MVLEYITADFHEEGNLSEWEVELWLGDDGLEKIESFRWEEIPED